MSASQPDFDSLDKDIAPYELAEILGAENVTRAGDNVSCSCPSFKHKDENPSASIFRSKDGATLLKCHSSECQFVGNSTMAYKWVYGVSYTEAAQALTTMLADLRAGGAANTSSTGAPIVVGEPYKPSIPPNLTLKEYADAKKLTLSILKEFRVEEQSHREGTALAFPCFTPDGDFVVDRRRLWMKAPDGERCFDHPFNQPVYPFGLDRLKAGQAEGESRLLLVEGESDTISLAHHGVLAVGAPGASSFKADWSDFLTEFEIIVWREHGQSGDTFVKKVGAAIPDALVLHDEDHDDPSDLHLAVNGDRKKFRERFTKLIDAARPISEVVQEIDIQQVAVKQGPWPEPLLTDTTPELDEYPICDLPLALYRFVNDVAETTQTSVDMVLMVTLSTVSACVTGKAVVKYLWPEPLQLWTGTVADSGTGKSPVFRSVSAPVKEWEAEERERTKDDRAEKRSRKAVLEKTLDKLTQKASGSSVVRGSQPWLDMIQELANIRKELEDFPPVGEPRVIAEDATPEALVKVMADNHERIFVGSSEADVLKILAGLYSNQPNTGLWKKAYDSAEPYTYDRVRDSTSIRLDRPALATSLMLQPVVLQMLRNKRVLHGEGLFGRFLYAVPKSNRGFRKTGLAVGSANPGVLSEYTRRIKTLLHLPFPKKGKPLPSLGFTPAALQLLYDLQAEFEAELRPPYGRTEAIPEWGNKLFSKTLRLAGVLRFFEAARSPSMSLVGGGTIGEEIVLAAGDLSRAAIDHALAAYGLMGKDETMETFDYVLGRFKILVKSQTQVTKRDLGQAVKNKPALRQRPATLDRYIKMLEERHVLRQVKTTGTGRPSVILVPNPELLADSSREKLAVTSGSSAGGHSGSFETFETVSEGEDMKIAPNPAAESKKIEDRGAPEEEIEGEIEGPDPSSEKIQPPGGGEGVPDSPDLQSQKSQNPSSPEDLPPTAELF